MAIVPRYDPQVAANTAGGGMLNPAANPDAAGAPIARALDHAGAVVDQIGDQLHSNALKMQEQDNQIQKDQAATEFGQAMNDYLHKGDQAFYNLRGKAAYDLYASGDVQKNIEALRAQYRETLGNPRAQILFDNDTRRVTMLADQNSAIHASTQRQAWFKQTDDNAVAEAVKLSSQATNDQQLSVGLDQLHSALVQQGAHESWDETTLRVQTAKAESGFYKVHVESVAASDPVQALALVQQYQKDGKFYGDEGVKLLHAVHSLADPVIGDQVAQQEQSKARGNNPTDDTAIANYVVDKYENNPTPIQDRHGIVKWGINSDAHPELGVAGVTNLTRDQAMAIYQKDYIAPFANANIPPQAKLAVIDSAILAGVGATKQMVAKATSNGVFDPAKFAQLRIAALPNDPSRKNGWIARIQDGASGGQMGDRSAAEVLGQYATMEQNVNARVASGELTRQQGNAAISQLRARGTMDAQIERATMADNYNSVIGGLIDRGDGHAATSMTELFKVPGVQAAYAQLPEAQKLAVQNKMAHINSVSKPMTHAELETLSQLQIQATTDPHSFVNRDIPAEAEAKGWSPKMEQRAYSLWSAAQRGQVKDLPANVNHAMNLIPIKAMLMKSDLGTMQNGAFVPDPDKMTQFWGSMHAHMTGYEAVHGKAPSDDELVGYAGKLLAGGQYHGDQTTSVLKGRGADGKSLTYIPDKFLPEAQDYFRRRGIVAPTMTQFSQLWRSQAATWRPE